MITSEKPKSHSHGETASQKTSARSGVVGVRAGSSLFGVVVAVLVLVVGLGVLLYPVVATQVSNFRQQRVAEAYADAVTVLDDGVRDRLLGDAEVYNRGVVGVPSHDPWRDGEDYGAPEFKGYVNQLNPERVGDPDAEVSRGLMAPMSQVVIPKIDVSLPIYHGTGKEALDNGVGHLYGSSLPVGGLSTHSVLTGHTGITRATLFDNLPELERGDAFYLNTLGRKMKYEVDQIRVVLPEDTGDLKLVEGEDLVTLITCTPYGINDHRLLVRGHRVAMDPAEEGDVFQKQGLRWQWWMWAILGGSLLAVVLVAWIILRARKRSRRV